MEPTSVSRRIALFGATGLAGSGVLQACLADPAVVEVVAVTRRSIDVRHPKLREVLASDFASLGDAAASLEDVDAGFYCLGTASSGFTEEAYRVVTKDYALEAARVLKAASPEHVFFFISGAGTNRESRMMWARVKAETEDALNELGLAGIVCLRPGMILADRPPSRMPWAMRAAFPVLRLMRFVPSLSIGAEAIGRAMLQLRFEDRREGTLENVALRAAAERYQTRMASTRPAAGVE